MKIFYSIILIIFSYDVLSKEITILNDISGRGFEIINHTKVKVHYIGKLVNGKEFDNSYKRGEPITFQIGTRQVIQGWEIGLIGMKIGGKRTILIPPELAYGSRGAGEIIPPNATLIFDIEIVDAIPPKYKIIDSKQMLLAITGNFIIIDIRTEKEKNDTGTIPGSINLIAFDKFGNFNPSFLDDYNNKVKDTDKVIFVSEKGEISSILENGFVENLGKKNIYSLDGGIQSLIKDNFELTKN